MAFELRSQSPLNQKNPFGGKNTSNNEFAENAKKSLSKSNSNIATIVDKKKSMPRKSSNASAAIVEAGIQLADPTGVTSYPDVKKAWNDNKLNYRDVTEPLGAIPLIGKIPKVIKAGFNLAKSISTVDKIARAGSKINKATSKVNKASKIVNQEKLGEAVVSPLNQKKSPLQKQKLSPKAAKAKAERDLAMAKTPDRRAKKADNQRRHRKDPSGKGKDWDHEDGRWESSSQNRGNDGNGTKSEKGKKYKINKNS